MSTTIDYQLYRREILRYVGSIVIKFHPFAEMVERYIRDNTDHVINSHRENPYYRNLCGEYSCIDTPMEVWSVEESKMVPFDKQLWKDYPQTAALYYYGSEPYKRLCQTYPNQVGLIKGIVYPVGDIDEAFDADDLTILRHEPSFLQYNEQEQLYTAAVDCVRFLRERWYVYDYGHEDQYYLVFMSQLYCNLVSALIKQRVENQDTHAVHNLHVWERLDSNGLKPYRDILSSVQSRWFYRNMRHLKENRGVKSNLIILADNLLKTLKVKLVGKKIFQQTFDYTNECITVPEFLSEDVVDYSVKGTVAYDTSISSVTPLAAITPRKVFFSNLTSRSGSNLVDMTTRDSMDRILHRVNQEGYYPKYSLDDSSTKEYMFGRTVESTVPSRLLEFQKYVVHSPYMRHVMLFTMESFMYNMHKGKLQYKLVFTDENTGIPVELSMRDGFYLLNYAIRMQYGEAPMYLPKLFTIREPFKSKRPLSSELPDKYFTNGFNYYMDTIVDVEQLLTDIPWSNDRTHTSPSSFMLLLGDQFTAIVKHIRECFIAPHLTHQRAFWYLYQHLLVKEVLELNLDDISYESWIGSTLGVADLIDGYNDMGDSSTYWNLFANTLISKLIPLELSEKLVKYAGALFDDTEFYTRFKQLFVEWTSHDLTYLDTDRSSVTWVDMYPVSGTTSSENNIANTEMTDCGAGPASGTFYFSSIVHSFEMGFDTKPTLVDTDMDEMSNTATSDTQLSMVSDVLPESCSTDMNVNVVEMKTGSVLSLSTSPAIDRVQMGVSIPLSLDF